MKTTKVLIPRRSGAEHKEGIALVIVLGMLSVLLIFGVAFSISMRTERFATRSFLDVVRARHLAQTALTKTLAEHITQEMQGRVYPSWDAFAAEYANAELAFFGDARMDFPTFSSIRWVPMSLRPAAAIYGVNDGGSWSGGVDWMELRDPLSGEFLGEYAFLVVNNSGLLDANHIGAREAETIPRLRGLVPGEIRAYGETNGLSVLPEINAPTLHIFRNVFLRFETIPELYYLTSTGVFTNQPGIGPTPPPLRTLSGAPPLGGSYADTLHVFSRYPRGFANADLTANTNVAYIGGRPENWVYASIASALEDDLSDNPDSLENAIPDIDAFIGVMHDYATDEYVRYPGPDNPDAQFNRISSMRVPMINEVVISNRLALTTHESGDGHVLHHFVYLTVETWHPFNQGTADRFEVRYGEAEGTPLTVNFDIPPYPGLNQPYQLLTDTDPITGAQVPTPSDFAPGPNSYQLSTFTYYADQRVNNEGGLPLPLGVPIPFETRYPLTEPIYVHYTGTDTPVPVDRVNGTWPAGTFALIASRALTPDGPPVTLGMQGASVNDPRINWDPANPAQWDTPQPTLGSFNEFTVVGAHTDEVPTGGTGPNDGMMYARSDRIRSVGELGFLLYDADRPWETIRLMEPDPQDTSRVLDRLTTYTNNIRQGLVNINTRQRHALKAALWTMPLDRYSTEYLPDVDTVTVGEAGQLADLIINATSSMPITNLSGMKELFSDSDLQTLFGAGFVDNKFHKESIVRNSIGLFGTRHNLFTIFVAARIFSDDYDPAADFGDRESFVQADQRAVAVVWRDPFQTRDSAGNATYQSWVQYFHWVTGALED